MKHLLLFLLLSAGLMGQKKDWWDTTRYQKFRSNLIVGVFQSYRNFNNQFRAPSDTGGAAFNNYYAESNLVTGIELNYDKFSLAFGLRSTPQKKHSGKGPTETFNLNFNVGGNIWYMENQLRYFRGFYDQSSPGYDSTFKETGNYYYQPAFTNTLLRSRFMFFTNHRKFAFRSNYVCNYRQLKSAATWIICANTSINSMHNDSSFFPRASQPLYGPYAGLRGLEVFGIAASGGGALTVVLWKAFFANVMLTLGPENQWRTYFFGDKTTRLAFISIAGDFRGSIGLNFRRCYFISTTSNDFTLYDNSFMKLTNRSLSGNIIFGWRFNSKTPGFYKKFQQTKLYQSI